MGADFAAGERPLDRRGVFELAGRRRPGLDEGRAGDRGRDEMPLGATPRLVVAKPVLDDVAALAAAPSS
jgi:hypothetical protein